MHKLLPLGLFANLMMQ